MYKQQFNWNQLIILVMSFSVLGTLFSCDENEANRLFSEMEEVEAQNFFVIRNSEGKIEQSVPVDLIKLLAKDIEKIKGETAKNGFLRTYDEKSGLLRLTMAEAEDVLQKQLNVASDENAREENDLRIPFTFRVDWGWRPWSGSGSLRTTSHNFNFTNPDPSSTVLVDMCSKLKKAGGKKQAMWGFGFHMWDGQGDYMEDNYPVRYRGYRDVDGWAAWQFVGSTTLPWSQSKHAEAFQIEMIQNPVDGNTLWDALYYRAYRDGRWLGWVSSGGTAGTPNVSKLQGACFRAYYF